jgi:large subunit ribosomal protein L4e
MELKIFTLAKTEAGKKKLPAQFSEVVRPDIISRAVEVIQSNRRQPYGTDPMAGKRSSSQISKRRRDYRRCYGYGISRINRKIMSRRGERMNWRGAFSPNTVGGRMAHPPKAEKDWSKKINKKENAKAIRSALSATVIKAMVQARGHNVPDNYPFIIESKIESLDKTKKVKEALIKLGFEAELERISQKTVRAGKGKMRGRKYKKKTGLLIVVADSKCALKTSAGGMQGITVSNVKDLNVEVLAPGARPGRITIFTDSAIEMLTKENLFM